MKTFYILATILSIVLFCFSVRVCADTSVDKYVGKQVKRQAHGKKHSRIRTLDFAPFTQVLKEFAKDAAQVEKTINTAENIREIQKLFDEKKLSAQQLVLFYLQRIQTHDPQLNAVMELNPEALQEAIACDNERSAERSPMHGIPVLLKDNIAVAGKMHNTAGAAALKDAQSDRDAQLVKHLRENGAIILGKTNLSEWANFMTFSSANGFSALGGQTRNPYGNFDVGGSSSGSASAVAKNLCCVAIGTETSGSIIYPASQNSVFALKPTLGVISQDHIIPITSKQDTAGPMAQNATDLFILFQAMHTKYTDDVSLDKNAVTGKKIGVLYGKQYEENFRTGDREFRKKMQANLKEAGAKITDIELNAPQLSSVDSYSVMVYDFPKEVGHYLQQTKYKITTLEEVIHFNKQQPRNYAPFGQGILTFSLNSKITTEQQDALVESNRKITQQVIDELLEKNDVDVIATLSNYFTLVYAPCGYPAISIPLGYRDNGEPIGMTLVARKNQDNMLLEIAYAYEQQYKPRQEPQQGSYMNNSDIVLGKLAISMNMITTQQLSQCMSIQKQMQQQGHNFSLVDILLKKKFISDEQRAMLLATAQSYHSQDTTLHAKPQQLGRYVIEKKIGQGGMGYVYKAWDPKLERFVALKVLIHATSEVDIKRFMREAKANAMLRHENIVAIYDMGEESGQPYFTMDYLEGGSLDERKKQLSFRQAVDILITMCKAVDFAHKNGVVHRDLKPANIMFDHDGILKVTDFGLAKVADDQKLSKSGSLIGTAFYMSPEQAQGKTREVDHRSDIFALGVILYELISGRVPFLGKNFQQTMNLISTANPKSLTKIKKTVPISLDIVCAKAMAKKKENRYSNALEFAEDLEKIRSGKRLRHRNSKYIGVIGVMLCCVMITWAYFFVSKNTPQTHVNQKPHKTTQNTSNTNPPDVVKKPSTVTENKELAEKPREKGKLYFPNEQQLPLNNVRAQMNKVRSLENKMHNAKNNSDQAAVNQFAIEMANGYHKAHVLRDEILSLQNIQPKTAEVLWRLVERCMTGKMYIHARYYTNEILWQFTGHPLREKAQQEQQKIINAFPVADTNIRQAVWSILRDLAYARVLRIEGKYKTCIDYYEQAWNKANKGAKLFTLSSTIEGDTLSLQLRNEFDTAKYRLSDKAILRNIDNNTWAIDDNWQNQYRLHRESDYQSGKVHIYVYAPLLELLPLLKSLQIMSYVHLKQFSIAQKELQNLQMTSSRWYPWISHILRQNGFIYEWPETLFSQGMYHFFSGNNNEAQKIFEHIEKNYSPWYVSGEKQLFHLNKNYLGQTPNLQEKKWWNMLSEDINKILDMFLVRGIMNGKLSNNLQIYQQTFEDLLNLEISPYMIRNHLADIYLRKQRYQEAIDNYALSRHLSPQDIVILGLGQIALKAQNFPFAKRCYVYLDQYPPQVYKSDDKQLHNFKNHVQQVLQQLGAH